MDWLLDLTAEQMRERSSRELQDFITPEAEKRCREYINKLFNQASEGGCEFICLSGYSPTKSFPLFGKGMPKDTPIMTQSLAEELRKNGLQVDIDEPFFESPENRKLAYESGMHHVSLVISWAE